MTDPTWLGATIITVVALLKAWRHLHDRLPAETRHRLGLLNTDAPVRELTLTEHKALYVAG